MNTSKLICVQEHWYFKFEAEKINICKDFNSASKFVDMDDPIPPTQKPRGYAGVTIYWHNSIDSSVRILPDGDHRIQIIEITTSDIPVILASVYAPCRGKSNSDSEFEAFIDQLDEICHKYNNHAFLLAGDWNTEIGAACQEPLTKRQKLLQEFLLVHNLVIHPDTDISPTFIHANGSSSRIDYIVGTKFVIKDSTKPVKKDIPINTSDHVPVSASFKIPIKANQLDQCINQGRKLIWHKINLESYQTKVSNKLTTSPTIANNLDLEKAIDKLCDVLTSTADALMPKLHKQRDGKRRVWNPDISRACKAAKQTHWQARQDPTYKPIHKEAKKTLRKEIRRETAKRRHQEHQQIMEAQEYNKTLMHKLVKKQRSNKRTNATCLDYNNQIHTVPADICNAFASHFEILARPSPNPNFDEDYREQVHADNLTIHDICTNQDVEIPPVTTSEVESAIRNMKNKKAADSFNIMSEHLKYGGPRVIHWLKCIIDYIFATHRMPATLKMAYVTPVYKKADSKDPNNYRGISVVPLINKLTETIIRMRIQPTLEKDQHALQKGFTKGTSPLNAALILRECILNSQQHKEKLFISFLDARKAFDVVSHESLLRKLYFDGIQGHLWLLLQDIHQDTKSTVKFHGHHSRAFSINQGVRQGGVLSADLYKRYNNNLLYNIEESNVGYKIGDINCASPTCADDVAVLAKTGSDLQALINIATNYSDMERFELQPVKSVVLPVGCRLTNEQLKETHGWSIHNKDMPVVTTAEHLGMIQDQTTAGTATTVDNNIKKARRALYSLMGAGLHGKNGILSHTSHHIYQTYVLPILLYGLEVICPQKQHLKKLEDFHRQTLKALLSIPTNVADVTPFILLGAESVEIMIHKRMLTLLYKIVMSPQTTEFKLLERTLSIGISDKSWFNDCRQVLAKYDLPSIHCLLQDPPTKTAWSRQVKKEIHKYWKAFIEERARLYSSLQLINNSWNDTPHQMWNTTNLTPQDIIKINIKTRIMTGSYPLQSKRAKCNQNPVDLTCPACQAEPECVNHFLLRCPALQLTRQPILNRILDIIQNQDSDIIIKVLLDASQFLCYKDSHDDCSQCVCISIINYPTIERLARELCFRLHKQRIHTKLG